MYWYYLVLKKCENLSEEPDISYYNEVIHNVLNQPILKSYSTYEYDSKNVFHCNFIFKCVSKIDFDYLSFKGCHLHLQKIDNKDDMFRIMMYIHKDYRLSIFDYRSKV